MISLLPVLIIVTPGIYIQVSTPARPQTHWEAAETPLLWSVSAVQEIIRLIIAIFFLLATIAFWFSGTPEAPVLGPATVHRGSLGSGQLTLGWKTISYSPVLQHEVLIQQVFTVFLDAHCDKRNDQKDDYLENWEELKVKPKEQPRNHRFQVFSASFLSNLTYLTTYLTTYETTYLTT